MLLPFETLVRTHGTTVLRVCLSVAGADDADDAWSETFLSALDAYPRLPADANVEAWLVTIARRKAIDVVRARGRRPVTVERLPEEPSTLGIPGQLDDAHATADEVARAVSTLPDRQRRAVTYHYLGGLPYQEVAGIIGGTTDAARRAAADGIRSLRRTMGARP
ncbi:sigma-70 family RNA polymerase sigma factor [Humibacter soli]